MTLDHRQHHGDSLRSFLSVILYPVRALVNFPAATGNWISENLSSRQHLLSENSKLHAEHLLLQTRLQRLEALESENMRLRELLGSSIRVGERTLIAELMTVDMAPFSQEIVINKGLYDDVYPGQPILDANGIMGQTLHVSPLTSTAILITDPSHAIPVENNRNGLRAIAVGTGDTSRLELLHIPNNADIKNGDLLVTSGLGARFPPGYPVAKVTSIEHNPGDPFAVVVAEPTAKLLSTREVLLVWTEHQPTDDVAETAATNRKNKDNGDKPGASP